MDEVLNVENQENNQEILSPEDTQKLLRETRISANEERRKAKGYESSLKEMKAREASLSQENERLKAQLFEILGGKETEASNNPALTASSQSQTESVRELLKAKEDAIASKEDIIKKKEKALEMKEIEQAIHSIYFSCGGIPDTDERNVGVTDLRFLPSKIIHNRIAPIVSKDKDGQLVILDENGEIEYNSEGTRKTIGDKIRELKDTESLKRFFLTHRDSNKAPQSISPSRGKFVDRELAKQGKADIDAIASGSLSVR